MKNDGGPAFPCQVDEVLKWERKGLEVFTLSGGMSLRDWFAGMALSHIAGSNFDHITKALPKLNDIAKECYSYADAMLTERIKP